MAAHLKSSWDVGQPVYVIVLVFVTVSIGWVGDSAHVEMAELYISVTVSVVAQN